MYKKSIRLCLFPQFMYDNRATLGNIVEMALALLQCCRVLVACWDDITET